MAHITTPPSSPLSGHAYATPKMTISIRPGSLMTPPDSPQSVRSHNDADARTSMDASALFASPFTSQQLVETGILGEGQWSCVKRCSTGNAVFAVKYPNNRYARKVLRHEARILSHLADKRGYQEHVVAFHGFNTDNDSIVLDCVNFSLEDWIRSNGPVPKRTSPSGGFALHTLTQQLVRGLGFLQRHGIVHGDIKPGNVLLEADTEGAGLRALYCDFSAARFVGAEIMPNDAAGTYEFMAPELFSLGATADSTPTTASDVYALGITIVYSGLGESPYSSCTNTYLRRALAMRGDVLSMAPGAWFGGLVRGAVHKGIHDRWNPAEWLQVLETLE